MSLRDTLTNENLVANFDNPFDLVNSAINEARARVYSGDGESNPHIASDVMETLAKKGKVIEVSEQELEYQNTPEDEICFPDEQEVG